jgi:hypothetical protein
MAKYFYFKDKKYLVIVLKKMIETPLMNTFNFFLLESKLVILLLKKKVKKTMTLLNLL